MSVWTGLAWETRTRQVQNPRYRSSAVRETMSPLRREVVTDSPRRHVMELSVTGGTSIVRIARLGVKGKICKDLATEIAIVRK